MVALGSGADGNAAEGVTPLRPKKGGRNVEVQNVDALIQRLIAAEVSVQCAETMAERLQRELRAAEEVIRAAWDELRI